MDTQGGGPRWTRRLWRTRGAGSLPWAHKQSLTPAVHRQPRGRPTDTAARADAGVQAGRAHTEHSRAPGAFGASGTSCLSEVNDWSNSGKDTFNFMFV